jgi:hypothetical protein
VWGVFFSELRKGFFQDFLFRDMPVDEQDYPIIKPQYLPEGIDISSYTIVSLDTMLKMNKTAEWDNLFKQIVDKDVCIKDDVVMNNIEMETYKQFYLGAYCFNIMKYCRNVYVFKV